MCLLLLSYEVFLTLDTKINNIAVNCITFSNMPSAVVQSSTSSRDSGQCLVTSEGVTDLCVPMWLRV